MQTYSQQIGILLERFFGKRAVFHEDYKQITLETKKGDLKFDNLRSSIRMLVKNVKTEKDFYLFFDKVIETPLP